MATSFARAADRASPPDVAPCLAAAETVLARATDAVRALAGEARGVPEVKRLVAHTPLDRPASGRVLQKAGFALLGETQDEHEGQILRVHEWELVPTR